MCKSSVNRRNVLRVVTKGGVTGTTPHECASFVVATLGADIQCRAKAYEIIEDLIASGEITLRDALLVRLSQPEKNEIKRVRQVTKRARRATLDRTAAHRHGGVRGLEPVDYDIPQDPVPPAWRGFNPRRPKGLRLKSETQPPIGGWAEVLEEINELEEAQFADWASQAQPAKDCCGLVEDFATFGFDERQFVS